MKHKKGQLTIFIIIGIILLLGVGIMIVTQDQTTQQTQASIDDIVISDVPVWAEPVRIIVNSCVEQIAIEGFKKAGMHGGYIAVDDPALSGRTLKLDYNPTESEVVYPSSDLTAPVAYWWHLKSPNDCVDCALETAKPTIDEIEVQISRYINRNLATCTKDFNDLEAQGFDITIGELITTTVVQEQDTAIVIDYPIGVSKGDSETTIENFRIDLDLDLKKIYELALSITLLQATDLFLEDMLMTLIGLKSGGSPDSTKIPPIYAINNHPVKEMWIPSDVEQKVKRDLLGSYIPLLQVNRTRDATHVVSGDIYEQGLYDLLFLNQLGEEFPNLKVNFEYNPQKLIYFDISPITGGVLTGISATRSPPFGIAPSRTLNTYQFFYDISFPVIVTIRDNTSLTKNGESGFTFRFALEGNIRDNKDLLQWHEGLGSVVIDNSDLTLTANFEDQSLGSCTQVGSRFQCGIDSRTYAIEADCIQNCITSIENTQPIRNTPTLACNPNQRISGNHTITIIDDKTSDPIEDVSITYRCGNAHTCGLGTTDNEGIFFGQSHLCRGQGTLTIEKPGHLSHIINQPILEKQELNLNLRMKSFTEKKVEVRFINTSNLFRVKRLLSTIFLEGPFPNNLRTKMITSPDPASIERNIVPYLVKNPGLLEQDILEVEKEINDSECVCRGSTTDPCNNCRIGLVRDNELLSSEIQEIKDHFNLPEIGNYGIRRGFGRFASVENFPYLPSFHNVRLEILPMFQYNDIERDKIVDGLTLVIDETKATLDYLDAIKADENEIDRIIGRTFTVDLYPGEAIHQRFRDYYASLKHEYNNIQMRTIAELANPIIRDRYQALASSSKDSEEISIQLQRIKDNPAESDPPLTAAFIRDGETSNITLIPGRYSVVINALDDEGNTIPKENQLDTIFFPFGRKPTPPSDINHPFVGGLQLNDNNGYWTVREQDLNSGNTIRFYVFKLDPPENIEDLQQMDKIEDYASRFRSVITPKVVTT